MLQSCSEKEHMQHMLQAIPVSDLHVYGGMLTAINVMFRVAYNHIPVFPECSADHASLMQAAGGLLGINNAVIPIGSERWQNYANGDQPERGSSASS